jgi:hypothetical protein
MLPALTNHQGDDMNDINISLDELKTIDLSPLIQSKLPVTCFDITASFSLWDKERR